MTDLRSGTVCGTSRRNVCAARRHCDQMQCGRCGLAWDVNDADAPACRPQPSYEHEQFKREYRKLFYDQQTTLPAN